MKALIEGVIRPVSERCKIPMEHFAENRLRLNFIFKEVAAADRKEVELIRMSESYILEDLKGMTYLEEEELEKHHLLSVDGKILKRLEKNSLDLACPHKDFIYVLSRENELFVGCPEMGNFHHSSFLQGKDVIGAGHLLIENGKIQSIDNFSGHYQPRTKHLVQTILHLYDKAFIDDETRVSFAIKASLKVGDLLKELPVPHGGVCKHRLLTPPDEIFQWVEMSDSGNFCRRDEDPNLKQSF